jgi:hypothetical protein
MLRPTQVVFGFLLFISIIAGGVMLFPSEQPDVPAPPRESPYINPITPKDKTQTQQFAQETQTIIRHLKAIEMLLTPDNNAPSPTKNIQTIADKLSTIETLLKPPESLLPPSKIPSVSVALPHGLIISVALIVSIAAFAPVLVMYLLRNFSTTKVVSAGLITGLTAVSGLTLFTAKIDKIFSFEFSLSPQRESVNLPTEQSITLHLPEFQTTETELDCGKQIVDNYPFSNPFRIGPFPDGLASTAEIKGTPSENVRESFEQLEGKIESVISVLAQDPEKTQNHKDEKSLIAVLLIGSADKRTLVGTIESYRSNVGLAQARAEWVHKILENNAILRAKPIITLNSGPSLSLITVANDSEKLALDRAVQVCALWQKKL